MSRRESRFLYRCTDDQGRLLYVGIAADASARIATHRRSWWGYLIADTSVTEHETRDEARAVEASAIASEMPRFNRQGRWADRSAWQADDYRDFYDTTRFGAFSSHQARRMEQTRDECLRRYGVDITPATKEIA